MKHYKLLFVGLLSLYSQSADAQSKIYVNASASGALTGVSWAAAFNDLSSAITSAVAGDTIFIAGGVYKPSFIAGSGSSPRDMTFLLKDKVHIYGGFAGSESKLSDRDMSKIFGSNKTILSGNIGVPDSSDNCYHVVTSLNNNYYLDGLVITGGNANGLGSVTISGESVAQSLGGGIYSFENKLSKISNVIIEKNYALMSGGGMISFYDSSSIIENTMFEYNILNGADPGDGGAGGLGCVHNEITIKKSEFNNNQAYNALGGGAVGSIASNSTFDSVKFQFNYATNGDGGGAMYNMNGSNVTIKNCEFNANTTDDQGGAMYNDGSSPIITDVLFYKNYSQGSTGAMENDGGSNAVLKRVVFDYNQALGGDGGAMQNWKSSPVLEDVIFKNNSATGGDGGAVYNYNTCSPTLNRCTFINNTTDGSGGAFYNMRNSNPTFTNTLFARNIAANNGGAVCNFARDAGGSEPSAPVLTNVTIVNNIAGNTGGAAFDDGFGNTKFRNSIAAYNYSSDVDDIDAPATMTSVLYNSIVSDEYFVTSASTPSMIVNPIFVDTLKSDYRLNKLSEAINKGDSSFYTVGSTPDISAYRNKDLRNADRIMDINIDLGAYEVCKDTTNIVVNITPSTPPIFSPGMIATFTASFTGSSSASPYYSWYKNGVAISGANSKTYTATAGVDFFANDSLSVKVSAPVDSECVGADTIESAKIRLLVGMGIASTLTGVSEIKIYPNPSNGLIMIESSLKHCNYPIHILDLSGRVLYTSTYNGDTKAIDLTNKLAAGTYLLKIENTASTNQVYRIAIQ